MSLASYPATVIPPSILPPYSSGYYPPSHVSLNSTGTAITADRLYGTPLVVPYKLTLASLMIFCTLNPAGNVRLGVYRSDASYLPGALLLDAGAVAIGTTGSKIAVVNRVLVPGVYWMAAVFDTSTPTIRVGGLPCAWMGFTSQSDLVFKDGVDAAFAYAALPDPFTAGYAPVQNCPRIYAQVT